MPIQVQVKLTGDWVKVTRGLASVAADLHTAADQAGHALAQYTAERVIGEYYGGPVAPLSHGTRERRLYGKRGGRFPPEAPVPHSRPLIGAAEGLPQAVTVDRRGFGQYVVHIPERRRDRRGRSLARRAMRLEYGGSNSFVVTPRMKYYLLALLSGVGGYGRRREVPPALLFNAKFPSVITTRTPARPVWRNVQRQMDRDGHELTNRAFVGALSSLSRKFLDARAIPLKARTFFRKGA